ncbi:MAG: DUF1819 family protein [Ignavibacteriales bacterium]|nr:DUF1819 family protein [Ignavibacteriales bacterium]
MSTGYHRLLSRPLMLKRTIRVVELFTQTGDWGEVRRVVFDQNIFQSNKPATINADYSEIKRRLITLSPAALHLMTHTSSDSAKYINLIAIYNIYSVFREFMSEYVYHRVQMGNRELVKQHFLIYIEELRFQHEELRHKREVSVVRAAEFIFQILRETGILNGELVTSPLLSYEMETLPELRNPETRRALLQ